MDRERMMTHFRFAIDGYVLGKWSIYQAGAQISEAMAAYYTEGGK